MTEWHAMFVFFLKLQNIYLFIHIRSFCKQTHAPIQMEWHLVNHSMEIDTFSFDFLFFLLIFRIAREISSTNALKWENVFGFCVLFEIIHRLNSFLFHFGLHSAQYTVHTVRMGDDVWFECMWRVCFKHLQLIWWNKCELNGLFCWFSYFTYIYI